ncbi:Endoplasmic reticulum-Golgi intermediate compartment protein 1 [Phytophthora cinnamomi]|uniref:Endoplasmic reticulum-Golgi intermediate compartment protein 1 n=1 Tax=Phytophthora cinnamomi TaxID=4785 RepID=UPI003559FEBF|nr:Endoplasmic reticulum-Golgi intermediate compartment protein 1 [Phytophthora cinnamomi]
MVLFLESEILRLLDLYVELHADAQNVAGNGVLLKEHARARLTRELNASFPREQPWTERQVAVKFKNLRGDYGEFRWLSAQPGFAADGAGMGDAWWGDVKTRRPKAHAFKGKLPWVFASRMQRILGDAGAAQHRRVKAGQRLQQQQQQQQLQEEEEAEELEPELSEDEAEQEQELAAAAAVAGVRATSATTERVETRPREEAVARSPALPQKRKRSADLAADDRGDRGEGRQDREPPVGGDYGRSLERSVEQSAAAAAGMARGFQDLITMFQEQTARCRALEQQLTQHGTDTPSLALAEQRSVLLALARALEQSARATADMAQGYRELVKAFVRETDASRLQREM